VSDDHRVLIDETRAEHAKLGGDMGHWCRFCSRLWPCLPTRLAAALEHAMADRDAWRLRCEAAERKIPAAAR
jgi:hypothetical protein